MIQSTKKVPHKNRQHDEGVCEPMRHVHIGVVEVRFNPLGGYALEPRRGDLHERPDVLRVIGVQARTVVAEALDGNYGPCSNTKWCANDLP